MKRDPVTVYGMPLTEAEVGELSPEFIEVKVAHVAARLAQPGGALSPAMIQCVTGIEYDAITRTIKRLKNKGAWPYVSLPGRLSKEQAREAIAAKGVKPEPRPDEHLEEHERAEPDRLLYRDIATALKRIPACYPEMRAIVASEVVLRGLTPPQRRRVLSYLADGLQVEWKGGDE